LTRYEKAGGGFVGNGRLPGMLACLFTFHPTWPPDLERFPIRLHRIGALVFCFYALLASPNFVSESALSENSSVVLRIVVSIGFQGMGQ